MDLPDGRTLHVYDTAVVTAPWRFDPAAVRVPVLLVHGGQGRIVPSSHGRWLAGRVPSAELWLRPEDGHVAVLSSEGEGLDEPGLSNDSSW